MIPILARLQFFFFCKSLHLALLDSAAFAINSAKITVAQSGIWEVCLFLFRRFLSSLKIEKNLVIIVKFGWCRSKLKYIKFKHHWKCSLWNIIQQQRAQLNFKSKSNLVSAFILNKRFAGFSIIEECTRLSFSKNHSTCYNQNVLH